MNIEDRVHTDHVPRVMSLVVTRDTTDEMTAAAIARLAGVGRAAVANWRRRYAEFPKPVGGSATSPTFSRSQVEAWLTATGKADQLATAGRTETGTQRISDPLPSSQMQERAIADLSSGELLAKVVASLLPRTLADTSRLANEADAPIVLDPACFAGTLLMAVADRFGDRVKLIGQDVQENAAAAAALNLRANPHDVHYDVRTGDSLLDDQLSHYVGAAAAVVCEPPFDLPQWPSAELTTDPRWQFGIPAPRDGELAWVQHCYAYLRPRGVAVVAVSPRTCIQASGQAIRAALVRTGVLRDVIALPRGLSTFPDTDVCLWILQRPYGATDYAPVRMVDLSRLGDTADVPHEFAAWQRLFQDADPTIFTAVPRLELLDGDVNLLPSRHMATRVAATADDLGHVIGRLQDVYARVSQLLPRFEPATTPSRPSYVTLGELERVGALTIRSRESTPLRGDVLLRTLGRPPTVATGTADDDAGVAQIVEIDETRLDAHFIATFLRSDASTLPVANTLGALSRDDLRRCRVPRMPVAEQRRYGDAFRRLHELQEIFTKLAKVSVKVIDENIHGLTVGTLTPEPRDETSKP